MYRKVEKCRICGNSELIEVVNLGEQMLTGVFPKNKNQKVTVGPVSLVKCQGTNVCGLLQMQYSYDLEEMYGDNYGYRSGLNPSMVEHLRAKVEQILARSSLEKGALVLDIGSNDSTTLQAYPSDLNLVGIDPTGDKFKDYYPSHINLVPDFFSASLMEELYPNQKAKVITSFSMFYDLEEPLEFMREIHQILHEDGIWVFEQSYMPKMLETNSYDTICHEHIEFYGLTQIKWMTDIVGLTILDVEFNDINGGSFSITVRKSREEDTTTEKVQKILDQEINLGLNTLKPYKEFSERVAKSQEDFRVFLTQAKESGKKVVAIGASTKGNVLLQYCGITKDLICCVGEVNSEKFGTYTPGTFLPITDEEQLLNEGADFYVVLPWHFRKFFMTNNKFSGKTLVFPLPKLEIIKQD